jgi:hypothetical protein
MHATSLEPYSWPWAEEIESRLPLSASEMQPIGERIAVILALMEVHQGSHKGVDKRNAGPSGAAVARCGPG